MNLVLIGYRGTGKTAVAESLANDLNLRHVGMDAELVCRFGRGVPEFVEENGWDAFRDEESKLARELGLEDNLLIDCGGGIIVRDANIEALRENGRVVWLKASVETIVSRIQGDDQRPSLTGTKSFIDEIQEVLEVRIPLYDKASDFAVDTDGKSLEEVTREIREWWIGGDKG
ncbi:MAG: shikimate kinase [Candidatus Omnitrophica bacterium]|nr:shikimate kinase [Candidatus Omnitrophota bacterium]